MSAPEIPAGARAVPLVGKKGAGRFALVDEEDFAEICSRRWSLFEFTRPGGANGGPYARATVRRPGKSDTSVLMHKIITGWRITDHVNHDGLDNRRSNLRDATAQQNSQNRRRRSDASSQFKGVVQIGKPPRIRGARITADGKEIWLGSFATEVDAARAYDAAALKYFGEFAYLNFPPDGRESSAA